MKRLVLILTLSLVAVICGSSLAEKAPQKVARVLTIDGKKLVYKRGSKPWFRAYIDMDDYLDEQLQTDGDTRATLQFNRGGQAGLDVNTTVEITTPTQVKAQGETLSVKTGKVWAKVTNRESDEDLQVRTSGGVMGVKGTEFLVEVDEETGETTLSVLEGEVQVESVEGESQTATEGFVVDFGPGRTLRADRRSADELRKNLQERFPAMADYVRTRVNARRDQLRSRLVAGSAIVRDRKALRAGSWDRPPLPAGTRALAAAKVAKDWAQRRPPRARPRKPPVPGDLQPHQVNLGAKPPILSWSGIPNHSGKYVVLLAEAKTFDPVLWRADVDGTSVAYPEEQPLEKGHYGWRVIPVNDQGIPTGIGSAAEFESDGWRVAVQEGDYPSGLVPLEEDLENKRPSFGWNPVVGAHHYVVLVSSGENLAPVLWGADVEGTSIDYPADAAPLGGGKYFWRITALDREGNLVGKAAETWFETDGWQAVPAR